MLIVASINPFDFVGQETPGWYRWLIDNKLYACLMVFFIGNAIETQLVSTGAFEVSLDNMPVWSKIESGRIPQPPELFQIIENHFNMKQGVVPGGGGGGAGGFKDEL
jgi:selT/selW/selH-like putative selenoprotein